MYKQAVINSLVKLAAKPLQEEYTEWAAYTNKRKELEALRDAANDADDLGEYGNALYELEDLNREYKRSQRATPAILYKRNAPVLGPIDRTINSKVPLMNKHDPAARVRSINSYRLHKRVDNHGKQRTMP